MGSNLENFWTDDARVALLKELHAEALSYGQIAKKLGCSRNSVSGKMSRLGLARGRERSVALSAIAARVRQTKAPVAKAKPIPAPDRPSTAPKPTTQPASQSPSLGVSRCKWPIGHPGQPGFHFCEGRAQLGKAYCPAHYERSVVPSKTDARGLARSLRRYA
jgi:GcrA cell cycle regulator